MVAAEPHTGDGFVTLKDRVRIEHGRAWTPVLETIEITDDRLRHAWGARMWRVRLTQENAPAHGSSLLRITQLS